ncbi:MAG: RsmE family RNA methyltransferase [Magnetococcus sp. WYHC-3]
MNILLEQVPPPGESDQSLAAGADMALSVWRARVGEVFTVVDPQGGFHRARLLAPGRGMRVFETLPLSPEPLAPRILVQSLPDRERMLQVVEKGVELGATVIQPILTGKSGGWPGWGPGQDKSGSWVRVALRAARQSRRALVPEVRAPIPLEAFEPPTGGAAYGLHLQGRLDWRGELDAATLRAPVALLVGPEGGWSPRDLDLLYQRTRGMLRLGGRVLRTETAGPAALAVLAALEADLPSR